jgi:hypothetical protein
MLRRRRAAEAAKKAAEATQNVEKAEAKGNTPAKASVAEKASKSRKKGDAK